MQDIEYFSLGKSMRTRKQILGLPGVFAGSVFLAAFALHAQQPAPAPATLPAASPVHASQQAPAPQQPAAPPQNSGTELRQSTPAIAPQLGTINGTATDVQDEVIPGATVVLEGEDPDSRKQTTANDNGFFQFTEVKPGTGYHLSIKAKGLADWVSPAIDLAPGQVELISDIKMELEAGAQSVVVTSSPVEIATEEVKMAEEQRVFGIVPNFYVVYDSSAPPLTAKLKFQLALRTSADPITVAGIFFMAGVNQGVRIPSYREGGEGYGQRVGAVAADGFSDLFFGGAVLPSLLHQDPRYFYQGTGSNRSRLMHALSAPFVCRGDNGRSEPNFSTMGGDVISAGFSSLYYPQADRTWTVFAENVMISTIERTASTMTQEFVLRHFTSGPKGKKGTSQER